MFDYRRTHTCNELSKKEIGKEVTLSGWVHRRRDHGGLIFIDLRDRYGLTQLIFDPDIAPGAHTGASRLRSEWVISIKGKVIPRKEGMANAKLATGEIEVEVSEFQVLSEAKTPPFSINDEYTETSEDLRLKYRYLDIRRGPLQENLLKRHKAMMATRRFLDTQSFVEVSTPILAKSTPEGARDYLVPSRLYPGNFYALPQSPQIFKQLLMLSGMDRYFQIAPCFRDEDLRADRQPEFHQIDIEMSFGKPEDIQTVAEGIIKEIFSEVRGIDIPTPFPRMSHCEAMERYGTDRPDLRFGMELVRIDDIAKESTFSIFLEALKNGAIVKAICVKGGGEISRREVERYADFVKPFGLGGLAWMKLTAEGWQSNIVKFFSEPLLKKLQERMKASEGDLVLMACANEKQVNQALDHLRRHLAKERGLIDDNLFAFTWVTDFPLFAWDEEEKRMASEHHPFTSPHPDDFEFLDTDPLKVRSLAYDVVLNGYEIGGGSQRIHQNEIQEKIFHLLKLTPEDINEKFGFFIEALSFGTPPHLGIALGFDRIVMILCGTENIREVIAFPKTAKASDLMMHAPAPVHKNQLSDLEIVVLEPKELPWV